MANRDNDFLQSLKVTNVQKENNNREENPSSDRDAYTCLKLMEDTAKVQNFLSSVGEQEVEGKKISTDISMNYFYNVCTNLGYAEYDFRKGKINSTDFNSRLNEICKNHDLDFDYLIQIVKKIDSLEQEPNTEENIKLAQEIEARAIEEHEKRMNKEENEIE